MAKFLIKASYTAEGAKGLLKEGGSSRKEVVKRMIDSMGGTLETFYYALGEPDAFAIVDVPNTTSAVAASLIVNATGSVKVSTTPLITPEELDQACQQSIDYSPPGA